ncbi:MAG: hypothetical protein CM1200mP15_21370 [Dehalococcoidia bacterium]|nr:MAG: hypothetical protein CM1200mP15_21370 [Dehalococcoidia bacterium]
MSVETVVVHVFYGGMPRDKAEKSLDYFRKGSSICSGMATPINPKSWVNMRFSFKQPIVFNLNRFGK